MYIDGTITTEFTGYWDAEAEEYVYPSARQNFMLFNGIPSDYEITTVPNYLSAADGDFSTDGITLTYSSGAKEDITIGQSVSTALSGTILNENGYLDGFVFSSLCQAWIGVVTASEAVTIPEGATCYAEIAGHTYYAIGAQGYKDGAALGFSGGGDIVSITKVFEDDAESGDEPTFWCEDGSSWSYTDASHVVPPAAAGWQYSTATRNTFLGDKYSRTPQAIAIGSYDAVGPMTITTWNAETAQKLTWTYIPMGIFDMSAVSVYGVAYTFEVFDRMTSFDAPAADWINSLDFTSSKTLDGLLQELMTHLGYYDTTLSKARYTISNFAVNRSLTISKNPFANNTLTYRQILQWIAEAMFCSVRLSRTGYVEFFTPIALPPVAKVIPTDVIVSQSRDRSRYTIPQITKLSVYGISGTYDDITAATNNGQEYSIVGNPFVDPEAAFSAMQDLFNRLKAIPVYNTSTFTDACADPRLYVGDWVQIEDGHGDTITSYVLPIMNQTITWRGNCVAEISATGNQKREPISTEQMTSYESAVNAEKMSVDYVKTTGDTMTGNLVVDTGSTHRTTVGTGSVKVENTSNTAQNTAMYYNGIVSTNGTNTATLLPTGLNLDGTILTSAIGTQVRDTATVNVPSGAYTELTHFSLPKGSWVIMCYARFASNATGRRVLTISRNSADSGAYTAEYTDVRNAVNGAYTMVRVVVVRVVGSTTTFYLNAYQNSGSTLETLGIYSCLRVL